MISIHDIKIEVIRKPVKHVYFRVNRDHVTITAPSDLSESALFQMTESKLKWIQKQQAKFRNKAPKQELQFITGENHYFQGKPHRLEVNQAEGRSQIIYQDSKLVLFTPHPTDLPQKQIVLADWYRDQLNAILPASLNYWQSCLGVKANAWRIRHMKTRWGTCNIREKRVCFNLELIKLKPQCLDYVVVHELAHLLERYHNKHFYEIVAQAFPDWREAKAELDNYSF